MLMTKKRRPAIRTLSGLGDLASAGAIREFDEHGWSRTPASGRPPRPP
jgi:hypothetical protein